MSSRTVPSSNPNGIAWTRSASTTDAGTTTNAAPTTTIAERIEAALELIRPAIRRDGGDVWLIRIDGDVAYVQMIGACGGCPASNATLKHGIEAVVREHVPEITRVEQL